MKEVLYKLSIFFLFSYCITNDNEYRTYDFIYIDLIPLEVAKNSIGIRTSKVNNTNRIFFNTQNWLADNLYFQGSFSPSINNKIDVIYNINFGYKTNFENKTISKIFYDFGYYTNRYKINYNDNSKWITGSVVLGINLD